MSRTMQGIVGLAIAMGAIVTAGPNQDEPTQDGSPERVVFDQDNGLRILVSNDDGIQARGLRQLVKALSALGDVVVCAPDSNRSGSSQAVPSLARPMKVTDVEVEGASLAVAVSGSPADAVCYGIVELGRENHFDLVVSGINSSANVGDLSHSSGTVGAAMEGVFRGVPSIAVSQGGRLRDYEYTAGFTARFVERLRSHGAQKGVVYSINVPSGDEDSLKGVAVRPMGGVFITVESYSTSEDASGSRTVRANLSFDPISPKGSDTEALFDGFVTVTPLRFDWTAREALQDLEGWELTVR